MNDAMIMITAVEIPEAQISVVFGVFSVVGFLDHMGILFSIS